MFDLDKIKNDSGLEPKVLARIEDKVREDLENEMMFEIHFIRAIHALEEGRLTLEQLLEEPVPA